MKRKIFTILVALMMVLGILAGCTGQQDPTEPPTIPTEEPTDPPEPIRIVNGTVTPYAIYYENDSDYDAACALSETIKAMTNANMEVKKGTPRSFSKAIIVGRSSLEKEGRYTVSAAELGTDGYLIKEIDTGFVITGVNSEGTLDAVVELVKTYLGFDVMTSKRPERVKAIYLPTGLDLRHVTTDCSTIRISGNDIKDYTIVYSNSAVSDSDKAVATYLRTVLETVRGETIGFANDESTISDPGKVILIGQTSLESSAGFAIDRSSMSDGDYVINCKNGCLLLAGKTPNATVAAVYEFVENIVGYTDAGFYPSMPDKEISIAEGLNEKGNVGFTVFGRYEFDYTSLRTNYSKFSNTVTCFSNETEMNKIRRTLVARARSAGEKVSCIFNTYAQPCTCESCAKAAEEEGTPYGAYFRFINSAAEAIAAQSPDIQLEILAYKNTYVPPKSKLHDNVRVIVCNEYIDYNGTVKGMCSGHAADDPDCPINKEFLTVLNNWLAVCKNVYILDFTSDYYYFPATFPNWKTLYADLKVYKNLGVKGVYLQTENAYQNQGFLEFRFLREYIARQFAKNPSMDEKAFDAVLDTYLQKAYGEYSGAMRTYIDEFSAAANNHCYNIYSTPDQVLPITKDETKSGASAYDLTLAKKLYKTWNSSIPEYSVLDDSGTAFFGKILINHLRKADRSANVEHARTQFSKWINANVHPFDETAVYNAIFKD